TPRVQLQGVGGRRADGGVLAGGRHRLRARIRPRARRGGGPGRRQGDGAQLTRPRGSTSEERPTTFKLSPCPARLIRSHHGPRWSLCRHSPGSAHNNETMTEAFDVRAYHDRTRCLDGGLVPGWALYRWDRCSSSPMPSCSSSALWLPWCPRRRPCDGRGVPTEGHPATCARVTSPGDAERA